MFSSANCKDNVREVRPNLGLPGNLFGLLNPMQQTAHLASLLCFCALHLSYHLCSGSVIREPYHHYDALSAHTDLADWKVRIRNY